MDNVIPFRKNRPCVELVEAAGEWFVRVVEKTRNSLDHLKQKRSPVLTPKGNEYG